MGNSASIALHSLTLPGPGGESREGGCVPWLVRVGGARPHPFTISAITYKVVVYAQAERALTLPLFLFYPYMYSVIRDPFVNMRTFLERLLRKEIITVRRGQSYVSRLP